MRKVKLEFLDTKIREPMGTRRDDEVLGYMTKSRLAMPGHRLGRFSANHAAQLDSWF